MNVSLTPELEKFIEKKLETGLYSSASEVVREALRLMAEKDAEYEAKLEGLRAAVKEGMDSGDAKPWDLQGFQKKARGRKTKHHGQGVDPTRS